MTYSVLSLNSLNLIMHAYMYSVGVSLKFRGGDVNYLDSREFVLHPECSTSIILAYHEMPRLLLVAMTV